MKIVLYGAGQRCRQICKFFKKLEIENIIIVDSECDKWNSVIEGYMVMSPQVLSDFEKISLYITVANLEIAEVIRKDLLEKWGNIISEIPSNELMIYALKESKFLRCYILCNEIDNEKPCTFLFDCYTSGLGLGGIEAWTKDVCQKFIKEGLNNTYIVSKTGEYALPEILKNNILYVEKHKDMFSFEDLMALIEVIIKKMPCKVITSQVNSFLFAACIVKQYFPEGVEICSVIHSGLEQIYMPYLQMREYIDIYVGVSKDIRRDMIEKGIDAHKIYSMTCPFPCERKIDRTYSLNRYDPIRIGYAGRMSGFEKSQKRMDLLLKVIKKLNDCDVNFYMELAGDGIARAEMEKYIYENSLDNKVKFLGQLERDKISDFWKRQDICVNIADYEGRCISKLEAMANGVVPIVTETAGMREDISDGINGYLVPIGDCQIMADRIRYLADNRMLLPDMGKKAHDIVYPKSLMSDHFNFWKEVLEF